MAVVRSRPIHCDKGEPLIDDSYIIYMNWDGFSRYYYDLFIEKAKEEGYESTLARLAKEGVFFDDLRTTFPSITSPCQNMILAGATSKITKNVYRYYDRQTNVVIPQARECYSKILPELVLDANITTASIHQFLAEKYYSLTDLRKIYIRSDNSNPKVIERGEEKFSDHFARMEQFIKLVKKDSINSDGNTFTIEELPRFILFYADDIDAIGHNEKGSYNYGVAQTEEERDKLIYNLIKDMDMKLGEFIDVCKNIGIYDKLTFFLTTDHGMTHFGSHSKEDTTNPYCTSRIPDLFSAIREFDSSLIIEYVPINASPQPETSLVAVGSNLNLQLTWKSEVSNDYLKKLKKHLEKLDFVYAAYDRDDLNDEGFWSYAADMIVTPSDRWVFARVTSNNYCVRGQHDSALPSSNHIVGLIWGKGIMTNVLYTKKAFNYDFGTTMAAALGIVIPGANGIVLDIFNTD